MLYESRSVRVELADGIATVWMRFPGPRPNTLSVERVRELERGIEAVIRHSRAEILVLRSGRPDGLCAGLDHDQAAALQSDADAVVFSTVGQRVCQTLAHSGVISVALLEGPCLGPGLELALACDYRLAVSGPDAILGFPDLAEGLPPTWGGSTRLASKRAARVALTGGAVVTAREALPLKLVDDVFCRRRAKIELRGWLDRLQARPRKARPTCDLAGPLAAERIAFRRAIRDDGVRQSLADRAVNAVPPADWGTPVNPVPPSPGRVGCVGADASRWAVEFALRGGPSIVVGRSTEVPAVVREALADAVHRGRATPLEADEAVRRMIIVSDVRELRSSPFIVATEVNESLAHLEAELPPGTVLAVPRSRLHYDWARPARVVGLEVGVSSVVTPSASTSADAAFLVATWAGRVCRDVRFSPRLPANIMARPGQRQPVAA